MPIGKATVTSRTEVLRQPGFRRLWQANALRDLGGQITTFALPVTAVAVVHATAFQMGILAAASKFGYLAIGLPAGVWVDRARKKTTVLILSDLAYVLSLAGLGVAYICHLLAAWQLVVVAVAISVADVFFSVAHTAILPMLLPKDQVADANARLQTSESTIDAVAPGLMGVAMRFSVAAPLLYLPAALLHALSILHLRRVTTVHESQSTPEAGRRRRFLAEIREGVGTLVGRPLLRLLSAQAAVNNLGAGMLMAVVTLYLLTTLNVPVWFYGILGSVGAVASIVVSLVGPRIRRRLGEIRMLILFSGLAPLSLVCYPVAGLWPDARIGLLVAAEILLCFSFVGAAIAGAGLRSRVTPRRLLGRTSAASRFITQGAASVGALIGGAVGAATSPATTVWWAVAVMVAAGAILPASQLRGYRTVPPEWLDET